MSLKRKEKSSSEWSRPWLLRRQVEAVALHAERLRVPMIELLASIVGGWLANPKRPVPAPRPPGTLSDAQRLSATKRMDIVKRWRQARLQASRRRSGLDLMTREFLNKLALKENIKLTRGTLYNWDRAMRREGSSGVVDKRIKGRTATQYSGLRGVQTSIKRR